MQSPVLILNTQTHTFNNTSHISTGKIMDDSEDTIALDK